MYFYNNTFRMDRSLDNILLSSRNKQEKTLLLQSLHLKELPDLHEFIWIEDLNLGNNKLTKVTKSYLPPNLKILELYENDIVLIKHDDVPESIEGLNLTLNEIVEFDGSKFINLQELCLNNNKICDFKFPPNCVSLDISYNDLKEIPPFPKFLERIDCCGNELEEILPNENLKEIDFSANSFDDFPEFPNGVTSIDGSKNPITEIEKLPHELENFKMRDCKISKIICELPFNLIMLDLHDNILTEMPDLPLMIEEVDLSDNRINDLKTIPFGVKILDMSDNCLTEIPEEIKKRDIDFAYKNNFVDSSDDNSNDYNMDLFWETGNGNTSSETSTNNNYKANTPTRSTSYSYYNEYDEYDSYPRNNYNTRYNTSYNTNYNTSYNTNYSYNPSSYVYTQWRNEHGTFKSNTKAKNSNPNFVSFGNKKTREV